MPSEWASAAGAEHRLGRAAGLGAVGLRVGPELQRHPDHLGPALALQQRRDGAVDPARHRDQDAARAAAAQPLREAAALASARCSASAASCAACRLAGVSPPIAASISSIPTRAASRTRLAVDQIGAAAVAARIAPQPSASKVAGDPALVDSQRDPREIAAGGAPGSPGESAAGRGAEARPVPQVVLEKLSAHAPQE